MKVAQHLLILTLVFFVLSLSHAEKINIYTSDEKKEAMKFAGEMVFVKGGCYEMGCGSWTSSCDDDEKPVHEVCVDDFYIGKYEVTQKQWGELMGKNPSHFKNCGDNCPVENSDWDTLQEYIKKLNQKTGVKFRLPTEAEWEYACRSGGKREEYSGSNSADGVAWHDLNSGGKTHSVGQKKPNGLGIYDMSGNVYEWVQDMYKPLAYMKHSRNNPIVKGSVGCRLLRGGGWSSKPGGGVRCASRTEFSPSLSGKDLGFRLLRTQ